jgi:hypothetical protein
MKKEQSLSGKILGWVFLGLLVIGWVYFFTHPQESGCTVNPYYGDDGCNDQYEN